MYPISVYFRMVMQFQTTMTLILGFTIKPPAEGLDEGSDVDLFFSLKGSELRKISFIFNLSTVIFVKYIIDLAWFGSCMGG